MSSDFIDSRSTESWSKGEELEDTESLVVEDEGRLCSGRTSFSRRALSFVPTPKGKGRWDTEVTRPGWVLQDVTPCPPHLLSFLTHLKRGSGRYVWRVPFRLLVRRYVPVYPCPVCK